jgi:transposase
VYIRRTTIRSRKDGDPYFTYRLVESVRTGKGVSQRTILNLGRHFALPKESWPVLARRIEEILSGQISLFQPSQEIERAAQRYAASIIEKRAEASEAESCENDQEDYHCVDINSLEMTRPRSVGIEHVSLEILRQLKLDEKLKELGLNRHQLNAAIGTIIGRMAAPGSESATHFWLQNHTGLGELLDYDYESTSLTRMYQVCDLLLKNKDALEQHLYQSERSLLDFEETITLYDLTNTYFEGSAKFNDQATHGRSKEKRSDCPLVTLGLVLDGSGFPRKSDVFEGNASEPKTLKMMIEGLKESPVEKAGEDQNRLWEKKKPTIVMDAGIATEDNIEWLKKENYHYLVVSRKRHREFSEAEAQEVKKDKNGTVKVQKVINEQTGEVELYCHSSRRELKEKAIQERFNERFEQSLCKLKAGLNKKGCVKKYDKVVEQIGRLRQKYAKASKNYTISVKKDEKSGNASQITWKCEPSPESKDSYPGVYCLRTDRDDLEGPTLWRTYTMLTDLEAVFRSLKSELGLRPVFHQKTKRVNGHLFISLLAYHLVHTIRFQLKKKGIYSSWSNLRKKLMGHNRTTVTMKCRNGNTVHIRKSTRPEPRQQEIYQALNLSWHPGRIIKKVIQ